MTKNYDKLPDIQCSTPDVQIPIRQVGVENVHVPFLLELKESGFYQLHAKVSMRTNLISSVKGISMSRLLLTLQPYLDLPLKYKVIHNILLDLRNNIGSTESYLKFEFDFPLKKKSPLSDHQFPIYYNCKFEGQLLDDFRFKFFQGVTIQYASYCPCSAELCKDLEKKLSKGFPHNQRSFADILVECSPDTTVWLEDIILSVEDKLKTLPCPIIKRVDEQEIAKIAASNPMFVEDAVRKISDCLEHMNGVIDWIVKCTHQESIHTSEAIAVNWRGLSLDGTRYL